MKRYIKSSYSSTRREAMTKYDVIEWLSDHETAYSDACRHFGCDEAGELSEAVSKADLVDHHFY